MVLVKYISLPDSFKESVNVIFSQGLLRQLFFAYKYDISPDGKFMDFLGSSGNVKMEGNFRFVTWEDFFHSRPYHFIVTVFKDRLESLMFMPFKSDTSL